MRLDFELAKEKLGFILCESGKDKVAARIES